MENVEDTRPRTLTDKDIELLSAALETRLTNKFYRDLGKGFWGLVWKALLGFLVFVAAQHASGFKFWK